MRQMSLMIPAINCCMLATPFAEIVGLLCHYRQEKGHREALDHQTFIEWLEYHRHEEIKNLIVNTAALRTEIDNLLRSEHAVMIDKLNQIQDILLKLLGRTEEFKSLALAVAPNAQLSDQAVSILRQFVESHQSQLLYEDLGGDSFVLQILNGESITVTEPQFIKDDLNQLCRLNLLAVVEYNTQGTPIYGISRNAVRFMEAVDGKPAA
jgi:hypothetical protein